MKLQVIQDSTETHAALPGLADPLFTPGPITNSARKTIDSLQNSGLLTEKDALRVEMILAAALAVDRGLRAERPTIATTTLYGRLAELMESLPAPRADDDPADTAFWNAVAATPAWLDPTLTP